MLVLVLLVIGLGNYTINRYLNADGSRDLAKYLPINGEATFERAKVHLFRSFPDVSIRLEGIEVIDSLAVIHGHPPLRLEEIYLRASIVDWRQKHLAIAGIELNGLTVNVFDGIDGYSNVANLIRKKIQHKVQENKAPGLTVDYGQIDVQFNHVMLNKIDEITGQHAHAMIDKIIIKNDEVDSENRLTLGMNKIVINDNISLEVGDPPILLNDALVKMDLTNDFSQLTFNDIEFKNGHIHLTNDSLGQSNYSNLFGKDKMQTSNNSAKQTNMILAIDGAQIKLDDIDFKMIDHPKNKHVATRIVKFNVEVHTGADTTAEIQLLLDVNQLAFNTKNGAYLRDSRVEGRIQAQLSHQMMAVASPNLMINDETFAVKANLYSDKKTASTLSIEKKDVQSASVKPLLTHNIQKSIAAYDVDGPFYARAQVLFIPGNKNPRVEVDLLVDNKTVTAKAQKIKHTDLSATFVNRIHDDVRQHQEDRKNVRLIIHRVKGEFNDFKIASQNALITSTPDGGDRIKAKANITGRAASASQFLNHDKFNFQEGNFTLSTDIDGSLTDLDDLISGTNLHLAMEDLEVHYPDGNAKFPFRILELTKNGDKTAFHIEGFTENDQRPFHIRGEVDRVESFLFPGRTDRLRTEANIQASSVSWEGIIGLFGKDGIFSSVKRVDEKQVKRSMKQTLSGIQQSFRPVVRIAIDTVFYGKDIQLIDFNTGLKFNDKRTLVLDETTFKIDKSNISLDGEVNINQLDFTQFDFDIELNHLDFDALMPKFDYFGIHLIKQIHDQPDNLSMKIKLSGELDDNAGLRPESIKADITYESFAEDKFSGRLTLTANPTTKKVDVVFGHSGHPRNFNHLLETDAYRFDKGWYTVSFNFDDNFETVAQMVEASKFNLAIDDAQVYITELGVTVPLTRIELASINNKGYYHLLLRSESLNQELTFNGVVNNVRHFAFKDSDDPYEIELEISSPRIVWDDLKQVIAYQNQSENQSKGGKALKESVAKVLKDFNPNVQLKIDKLEYSDKIGFDDIYAHAYLDGDILNIDSANVSYGDSHIKANVNADMGHDKILPFHMQLQLTNIDIGQTLTHFDYFNVAELREAKQLKGNIWFDLDMQAEMNLENRGFNHQQTMADIKVKLQDVVIEGLHTLDTITEGIGFEKRFQTLRFAPLESRIKVKGQRIEIRETEIQSNAMHAFVEGALDKDSPENLWIAVPLKNIKKPDLKSVADKTGYEAGGRKIYLQWITSRDEDNGKMKVHLRKKKFFQERFKVKQFRAYKRINRRERGKLRQEQRQSD
jgi:hypothetical protein